MGEDRGGLVVDSPPTIYDVAARAGVSTATVSRALNSLSSVRPATREKVFAAMEELEFVPNVVARGLSSGKHWILGLVFTRAVVDNDNHAVDDSVLVVEEASLLYTDIVIRGAEMRAAEHGYSLLLSSADERHPSGMTSLLNLTGTVDGLILLDRVLKDEDVAYLARRIPVVLLAGRGNVDSLDHFGHLALIEGEFAEMIRRHLSGHQDPVRLLKDESGETRTREQIMSIVHATNDRYQRDHHDDSLSKVVALTADARGATLRLLAELSDDQLDEKLEGAPWADGTIGGVLATNADHARLHWKWVTEAGLFSGVSSIE
jgi:DNA-binding LacI/PurR family transcriptional regulator